MGDRLLLLNDFFTTPPRFSPSRGEEEGARDRKGRIKNISSKSRICESANALTSIPEYSTNKERAASRSAFLRGIQVAASPFVSSPFVQSGNTELRERERVRI